MPTSDENFCTNSVLPKIKAKFGADFAEKLTCQSAEIQNIFLKRRQGKSLGEAITEVFGNAPVKATEKTMPAIPAAKEKAHKPLHPYMAESKEEIRQGIQAEEMLGKVKNVGYPTEAEIEKIAAKTKLSPTNIHFINSSGAWAFSGEEKDPRENPEYSPKFKTKQSKPEKPEKIALKTSVKKGKQLILSGEELKSEIVGLKHDINNEESDLEYRRKDLTQDQITIFENRISDMKTKLASEEAQISKIKKKVQTFSGKELGISENDVYKLWQNNPKGLRELAESIGIEDVGQNNDELRVDIEDALKLVPF
jgi:hypothetical protein